MKMMDKTLIKMRSYYSDCDTVRAYLKNYEDNKSDFTEMEIRRARKAALDGLEARRAKAERELRIIFDERIDQAREDMKLKPNVAGVVSDTLRLIEQLGDPTSTQLNNILEPLRNDNAALNMIHSALKNSGRIKPSTLSETNFGADLSLEVSRHEIMRDMCLGGLKLNTVTDVEGNETRLQFFVGEKMFAGALGYQTAEGGE